MDNKFYTAKETCGILRVSLVTLYKAIRKKELKASIFSRNYRISEQALQEYINSRTIK